MAGVSCATLVRLSGSGCGVSTLVLCAAYLSSRHGVIGSSKVAAIEMAASDIRVNAVLPGPADTDGGSTIP
ncbi:SDR family oxidoreductase [Chondromyces crocatus]|uniref:SDR family oxidoreductase n=1 Tax=Chondromyces crocatus TaxID=52 RepID=UPI0009EC546F|nr:SDR family oxidoreductase [Chondromyces crocatus]